MGSLLGGDGAGGETGAGQMSLCLPTAPIPHPT